MVDRVTVAGVLLGLVAGLVLGVLLARLLRRPAVEVAPAASPADVPSSVEVIDALPAAVAVLAADDRVVLANRSAVELGVVRGPRLLVPELRRLARDVRRTGTGQEVEVEPARTRMLRLPEAVRVRVAPVEDEAGHVVMLVEDVTEARRVEAVRRDFVANVSHELKTPVGGMSLLAEALVDAAQDPEAVRRFGSRLQKEAGRLARLVQELIDLSRLQGADPLPEQDVVPVDRVIAEAVELTRLAASSRSIALVQGGTPGLTVQGSEAQLVTAVRNLLENAVHYSPEGTRVAVAARAEQGAVEILVTDQGIGIAERDLERVFERFYRADPARSRETGGTGLGLAIVKHVATNHGGEVSVWSVEGSGSTFTLRLPPAGTSEESA
ncbi:MAG: two-component sensor histidine kinase [Frankiales bacterium]|nr:MAG: two-component sensor histidine kinase [Frankiales bacterium]